MTLTLVLPVRPVTKKTSNRVVYIGRRCHVCKRGQPKVLPSELYTHFETEVVKAIGLLNPRAKLGIDYPVNMAATFYRERRAGDLSGYVQALQDALQKAGVLKDDKFVASLDGTRLALDPKHPRIVLTLTSWTQE